jgi:DNA-binding beta-propeller fold protein YncE
MLRRIFSRGVAPAALILALLPLLAAIPWVTGPGALRGEERPATTGADEAYRRGVALQRERRTLEAIAAYREALRLDPFHARAHYELGWSYWVLGQWPAVVRHWELAAGLKLEEPGLGEHLRRAREELEGKAEPLVRVPIGTRALWRPGGPEPPGRERDAGSPAAEPLSLELVARFQHFDPAPEHPADRFDPEVFSPKSAHFAAGKVYVNALEGFATLVFDTATLARRKVIRHVFGAGETALFAGAEAGEPWAAFPARPVVPHPDRFSGKPVEFAETHGGRYLWVSYYRREFDANGVMPSAVAVIDTGQDAIVRVIDSGPIPKFLAASPDGHWLAVVHWGDNTVGLLDVSGGSPEAFRRAGLITVGHRLSLAGAEEVDRERYCGFCLRGAVFTRDSRHLLVGRMGGGGIAVLDVAARTHLGTVRGMPPTPRQLALSPDAQWLYVGSNMGGYVSLYRAEDLVEAARQGHDSLTPLRTSRTGVGTRTLALSPDGSLLFAAVNNESKVVALDARTLAKRLEIPADSYPVGLALSPDGDQLWVTSQGRDLRGGNSVSVYRISRGP